MRLLQQNRKDGNKTPNWVLVRCLIVDNSSLCQDKTSVKQAKLFLALLTYNPHTHECSYYFAGAKLSEIINFIKHSAIDYAFGFSRGFGPDDGKVKKQRPQNKWVVLLRLTQSSGVRFFHFPQQLLYVGAAEERRLNESSIALNKSRFP